MKRLNKDNNEYLVYNTVLKAIIWFTALHITMNVCMWLKKPVNNTQDVNNTVKQGVSDYNRTTNHR